MTFWPASRRTLLGLCIIPASCGIIATPRPLSLFATAKFSQMPDPISLDAIINVENGYETAGAELVIFLACDGVIEIASFEWYNSHTQPLMTSQFGSPVIRVWIVTKYGTVAPFNIFTFIGEEILVNEEVQSSGVLVVF
ncbi:hypothetical protein DFH08DRAFT_823177 [Mycena albidolilacea]|uniref:Uncharacterized protein n=1 Tax=Mycena albidolilacea TaxID=1033008 RepID=A0AAD7EBL7_9AGAR|nr:hypothetical protein DFH08DRAFT_823177 [Mycena albidolilacea]